jgi:TonB dependent receptor/TonB-dependent Receptor Plug Domain
MERGGWQVAALLLAALCADGAGASAQPAATPRAEPRRLDEALAELQRRGLNVIFSNQVVRPDMRVRVEPRDESPRRALDDLLSPHGLIARDGPGRTVLVVRNPRARLAPPPAPPRPVTAAVPSPAATREAPHFAEAIDVTDTGAGARTVGSPVHAVRASRLQSFAGGVEPVFRTLQTLPGVTSVDELGGRLAVRGGSPEQNLTVMDGIELHQPFRLTVPIEDLALVGLGSVLNPDTLDRVELVPGAFDVRHGDRLSSLVLVTSREGSEAEPFQGSAFLNLMDANVILEGALPRRVPGSWLISARRSHLDLAIQPLVDVALPAFHDGYARGTWRPRSGQRLSLLGLSGREQTRFGDGGETDAGHATRVRSDLLAATFESPVGASGASRTQASFSRLTDSLAAFERSLDNSRGSNTIESIALGAPLAFEMARDLTIRDLAIRQELTLAPWTRHGLDAGVAAHGLDTRWSWRISGDRSQLQPNGSSIRLGVGLPATLDSARRATRLSAWIQDRWWLSPRVTLQPGLRVDRSSVTGRTTFSPRLGGTVSLGAALRLDAAVRVHHQTPGYEKMLLADYFVDLTAPEAAGLRPERAIHAVAGLERVFRGGLTARVDAYYKRFDDLVVGRLETDAERRLRLAGVDVPADLAGSVPDRAQITTTPQNGGQGRAYGLELQLSHVGRRASSPLSGWATYSFGRATRTAYGTTRPFDYDRRHALTAVAAFRPGPRLELTATARWAAGLPRTPVRGVQLALEPDASDADGDQDRAERIPQRDALGFPIFQPDLGEVADINAGRLPAMGRVDARVTYRPSWGGERWALYLDVVNVLNRRNVTQVDSLLVYDAGATRPRITERPTDRGVPVFPSVGIRFWF